MNVPRDKTEEAEVIASNFCKLMDGEPRTFKQHIEEDRIHQSDLSIQSDSIERSPDAVIRAVALKRIAHTRTLGKALGSNCIVADLQ